MSPVSDSAPPAIDGDACRGKQASGRRRALAERSGDGPAAGRPEKAKSGRWVLQGVSAEGHEDGWGRGVNRDEVNRAEKSRS